MDVKEAINDIFKECSQSSSFQKWTSSALVCPCWLFCARSILRPYNSLPSSTLFHRQLFTIYLHHIIHMPSMDSIQQELKSDEVLSPEKSIERKFDTLKRIHGLLGREPSVIHIAAKQDRLQQLNELEEYTERYRTDPCIVLMTSMPEMEIIRWPSQSWNIIIKCDPPSPSPYGSRIGRPK